MLRILILLLVLLAVALTTWQDRHRSTRWAFAAPEMNGENNVVIAHELLHTVGATDKYGFADNAPRFPEGYGEPAQKPLYPQLTAELMAGRRMLAPDRWQQAASLDEVVVGPATALEIRWPQHAR